MTEDQKGFIGVLVCGAGVWVIGSAAYVLHMISSLDWAASVAIPAALVLGSVGIGAKLESPESQIVAHRWPAFAAASVAVPWVLLAYFLNHQIVPPRALHDSPAVTFGFWMAMASPFMLAWSIYFDRYLKMNAIILEKWGPVGGGGSGGGKKPAPKAMADDEDEFGFELPISDPDTGYDRSRYIH